MGAEFALERWRRSGAEDGKIGVIGAQRGGGMVWCVNWGVHVGGIHGELGDDVVCVRN